MKDLLKHSKGVVISERTNFQLEKFVIGQHDTPEMQYRQILIEAQMLIYTIETTKIKMKKTRIEIQRLEATNDEIDALEAQEKRLDLELTRNALLGAENELNTLEQMYKTFPKYSNEEIEANQPIYWQKRLIRQAQHESAAAQSGISASNLHSMQSIGLVEAQEEIL